MHAASRSNKENSSKGHAVCLLQLSVRSACSPLCFLKTEESRGSQVVHAADAEHSNCMQLAQRGTCLSIEHGRAVASQRAIPVRLGVAGIPRRAVHTLHQQSASVKHVLCHFLQRSTCPGTPCTCAKTQSAGNLSLQVYARRYQLGLPLHVIERNRKHVHSHWGHMGLTNSQCHGEMSL